MVVLVTGGRSYHGDVSCLEQINDIDMLIHGGASGADIKAAQWAQSKGIHTARVDALWNHYNKAAGYKRNSAMLLLKPDYCVAFPGGRGTAMMIDLCRRSGIPVWQPYSTESETN
jgi:hypothetical protein